MKILQVEDDIEWFEDALRSRLEDSGRNEILHAATQKEAFKFLESNNVDYLILDLAIPKENLDEPADVAVGLEVAFFVRRHFPGLPVLILTGQSSERATEELEEDNPFAHFWDGNNRNIRKIRKKRNLDDAVDLILEASEQLRQLDSLEISCPIELSPAEKRSIKVFTISNKAIAATVTPISGGLSGSSVFKVELLNEKKQIFLRAISKIDYFESVDLEISNFRTFVTRLKFRSSPSFLDQYFLGCGNFKGAYFQLADEFQRCYFDILKSNQEETVEILNKLREIFEVWHQDKKFRKVSIADVRRMICTDEKLADCMGLLKDVPWQKFETNQVNVNFSIQHGDLHGANILVSDNSDPVIIDYGDIRELPSSLDPITLELSCYFHPDSRDKFTLSDAEVDSWFADLDSLDEELPRLKRIFGEWINQNQYLKNEAIAVTYAYSIRQLTYPGTDKSLALKIISSAISAFQT